MFKYDESQIKEIIKGITKKDINIKPIGNHHLKRHLVYYVEDTNGNNCVFKLYCKKNRCNREIACLKLLANYDVACPKLIDYGVLEDGTEWVLLEHIKGEVLEKVLNTISEKDLCYIYEQMGEELGKIHSIGTFKYFGNWDENCNSIDKYTDYYSFFKKRLASVLKELLTQDLPNKELHRKGADLLISRLSILKDNIEPRLCHNDFDERNVMVYKNQNKWRLEAIIDFEQGLPCDKDKELINLYFSLLDRNIRYAKAFRKGYQKYLKIDDERIIKKRDFYRLYTGLNICSWANKRAPDYYKVGLKLIKEYIENS
ncbi:aminoglycoside phosphotransferase family protein [Thermohalobacter berrensis]|uniref:Aminoglycoside phosphotransferase domain-containing protein n=1 Tax=Thermohalobacter berrensis TaxID=99594 RepID=A0A419SXN6_9FIRM|nr:aminoglycoside phosphotransferase family protein [Thermohalobacter berrensis]RKD30033.1 hypothetical protein BET03_04835 [Thermohalobacter berrensis]